MSTRILFLGEIVGKPGIQTIKSALKNLRVEKQVDLVVANGEGTTNGFGIGRAHAIQLQKLGIDIITGGEKIYYKLDMVDFISKNPTILRPANYPQGVPGRGVRYVNIGDKKAVIINLLGNSDFPRTHLANPFNFIENLVEKAKEETPLIFVQFHASTTAEKNTMAFLLDGRITAMIGTHTKVMSADARIFPKGMAMITDNGRCGSQLSVGGFDPKLEINKTITQIPVRSRECWEGLELQGVLVEADDAGKAVSIETIRVPVETPPRPAENDKEE